MPKPLIKTALILSLLVVFTGCNDKVIYNRSVGDLNAKAQELLNQGDTDGAIGRLQSALDLSPNEPSTLYNLGIAYQSKGDLDRSITYLEKGLQQKGGQTEELYQSLAVVYEDKGDALRDKLAQAKTPAAKEKLKPLEQQATEAYNKALAVLEKGLQAFPQNKDMPDHLPVLKNKLEKHPSQTT